MQISESQSIAVKNPKTPFVQNAEKHVFGVCDLKAYSRGGWRFRLVFFFNAVTIETLKKIDRSFIYYSPLLLPWGALLLLAGEVCKPTLAPHTAPLGHVGGGTHALQHHVE